MAVLIDNKQKGSGQIDLTTAFLKTKKLHTFSPSHRFTTSSNWGVRLGR
ncbi:MAG: hypothetical protein ACJAZP_001685 [Psychromonas sp.]|jgi:hypothetical protein